MIQFKLVGEGLSTAISTGQSGADPEQILGDDLLLTEAPPIKVQTPELVTPDGLDLLDKLPIIDEEELPPDFVHNVFTAIAEDESEQILKDWAQFRITDVPENFDEMLDDAVGAYWQRALKAWIKPSDPEGTIRLMQSMGVDKFQELPKALSRMVLAFWKSQSEEPPPRSNYNLSLEEDNRLVGLLDFATNQTTLNEIIHLLLLPMNIGAIALTLGTGQPERVVFNLGIFALNTYCVLSQRYARARLSRVINRILKSNHSYDLRKYQNRLGLKLKKTEE